MGLVITARIDTAVKEHQEEISRVASEARNCQRGGTGSPSGDVTVDDIGVEVVSLVYPLRSLSLYLLHEEVLRGNLMFVGDFSQWLPLDVSEWLAVYLCALWSQMATEHVEDSHTTPKISPLSGPCRGPVSPFQLLSAWFRNYDVSADSWCCNHIVGRIATNRLMGLYFTDCLKFITTSSVWIDKVAFSRFRTSFLSLLSKGFNEGGCALFDSLVQSPNYFVISRKRPRYRSRDHCSTYCACRTRRKRFLSGTSGGDSDGCLTSRCKLAGSAKRLHADFYSNVECPQLDTRQDKQAFISNCKSTVSLQPLVPHRRSRTFQSSRTAKSAVRDPESGLCRVRQSFAGVVDDQKQP